MSECILPGLAMRMAEEACDPLRLIENLGLALEKLDSEDDKS